MEYVSLNVLFFQIFNLIALSLNCFHQNVVLLLCKVIRHGRLFSLCLNNRGLLGQKSGHHNEISTNDQLRTSISYIDHQKFNQRVRKYETATKIRDIVFLFHYCLYKFLVIFSNLIQLLIFQNSMKINIFHTDWQTFTIKDHKLYA